MLMIVAAMFLAAIALTFTDAEVFKDSAVKQMLLMLGGSIAMLLGELLATVPAERIGRLLPPDRRPLRMLRRGRFAWA